MTPNNPNTCSLPPIPEAFSGGAGGVVENTIILCGGYSNECSCRFSTCHIFDNENKTWTTVQMSSRRNFPASSLLNGSLWITGGLGDTGKLSTSDMVYPNGKVRPGPLLPISKSNF